MKYENPTEGGTYILDPKTGKSKLVQQTTQAEPPTEVTKDGTTNKKESNSD
tara:strand:+ start:335 stop:487 length:153 start_codon:yes stop_codon:yes gene_type:complete